MNRFLIDADIFELLGLNYDEKKRNEYLAKMLRPVLIHAIQRGVEESNLPEDKLDYLLELVDKDTDSETLQMESFKLMPSLVKIIEEETYTYKKGALASQLLEVEALVKDKDTDDFKYFLEVISDLKTKLESEAEDLESTWKLFNEQRTKFFKKD